MRATVEQVEIGVMFYCNYMIIKLVATEECEKESVLVPFVTVEQAKKHINNI